MSEHWVIRRKPVSRDEVRFDGSCITSKDEWRLSYKILAPNSGPTSTKSASWPSLAELRMLRRLKREQDPASNRDHLIPPQKSAASATYQRLHLGPPRGHAGFWRQDGIFLLGVFSST
jgi:hypothetical protein